MKSGRFLIVLVLIGALALAGAARQWAYSNRAQVHVGPALPTSAANQSNASLTTMNSYALALLLGGLRGPLVMFLWPSSEMQKTEHNLEDFDTKVEWIRLLQPEFDTVHLYQIWNKAYNISVQMASLPNKYATILDAMEYAKTVDGQKPDDINIVTAIAQLYSDKLGGSQEKIYYTRRVRLETQAYQEMVRVTFPHEKYAAFLTAARRAGMDEPVQPPETDEFSGTTAVIVTKPVADAIVTSFTGEGVKFDPIPRPEKRTDLALKRRRVEPLLDEAGNILPDFIKPLYPRPADKSAADDWYDGSALQFLPEYGPYPYGLSPTALGYNYYRRAQMLGRVAHETHIQMSELVIDSQPALRLKVWGSEEADRARRAELRLFGIDDQGDPNELEFRAPGANADESGHSLSGYANRPDPAALPMALYSYGKAARLFHDSRLMLMQHVQLYPVSSSTYNSHIDEALAFEKLYQADHDFLDGIVNPASQKQDWTSAAAEYNAAKQGFELAVLRYFTADEIAAAVYPLDPNTNARYTRATIGELDPARRGEVVDAVLKATLRFKNTALDQFADERSEEMNYRNHAMMRSNTLAALTGAATRPAPQTAPAVR